MPIFLSNLFEFICSKFCERMTRISFLDSGIFYRVLTFIPISLVMVSCNSPEKSKTGNHKQEVNVESLKSHMAMRQYFSQLIKNDEITNPYYGDFS